MTTYTDTGVQRLLILQVLERREAVSRAAIVADLSDIESAEIDEALRALELQGALRMNGDQVTASPCLRHLDRLGLISI